MIAAVPYLDRCYRAQIWRVARAKQRLIPAAHTFITIRDYGRLV